MINNFPIIVLTIYSMSMKVPFIVNEAKEALESGNCVVIGLQTTGEVSYPFQKKHRCQFNVYSF